MKIDQEPSIKPENMAKRANRRLMTIELTEATPTKSQSSPEINQTVRQKVPVNETAIERRRSTRIMVKKNAKVAARVELKVPPKIKRHFAKNKLMAAYYSDTPEKTITVSKNDHLNAIMDVINRGTLKEIKVLPTIGNKLAYQIVTYRAIKGRFQKLQDVKEGLDIKDKTWEKFLEVILNSATQPYGVPF